MTDLTTSRSTAGLRLTYGVAREVILVKVTLLGDVLVESLDLLNLGKRCQGDDIEDLCLSTLEHRRAMDSRNQIHLCLERTDLLDLTTIRSLVILQDHLTNGLLLVLIYGIRKLLKGILIICKCLLELSGHFSHVGITLLLVIGEYRLLHLFFRNDGLDLIEECLRNRIALIRCLFLTTLGDDGIEEADDLLIDLVCLIDGLDHLIIRDAVCTRLDHDDLIAGRCNGQIQIGYGLLCVGRVDDELTVDHTDLSGCAWTVPWNV